MTTKNLSSRLVPIEQHNRLTAGPAVWTSTRIEQEQFQIARSVFGCTTEEEDRKIYWVLQAYEWKRSQTSPAQSEPNAASYPTTTAAPTQEAGQGDPWPIIFTLCRLACCDPSEALEHQVQRLAEHYGADQRGQQLRAMLMRLQQRREPGHAIARPTRLLPSDAVEPMPAHLRQSVDIVEVGREHFGSWPLPSAWFSAARELLKRERERKSVQQSLTGSIGISGQAATQDVPADMEDPVTVPRGLLGAACHAIERKHDAPKLLTELRRYTVGDLSRSLVQPTSAEVMEALLTCSCVLHEAAASPFLTEDTDWWKRVTAAIAAADAALLIPHSKPAGVEDTANTSKPEPALKSFAENLVAASKPAPPEALEGLNKLVLSDADDATPQSGTAAVPDTMSPTLRAYLKQQVAKEMEPMYAAFALTSKPVPTGVAEALRDTAKNAVDAYFNHFTTENGNMFGPIDAEIRSLRAALTMVLPTSVQAKPLPDSV